MPAPVFYQVIEDIDFKEQFALKKEFKFVEDPLSWGEKRLLRRVGTKLQALIDGAIISTGPDDQHFVEVCKNNAEPNTKRERAWLKYHAALKEEKRLEAQWLTQKKASPEYEEYLKSRF
jgi:uncharacterized protein YifE (UPF0438 family)